VKEGGEPSLFLPPSEQFSVAGIESEGVAVSEHGVGDMTASHRGSSPPAACERTRVARLILRSRSSRGMGESNASPVSSSLAGRRSPLAAVNRNGSGPEGGLRISRMRVGHRSAHALGAGRRGRCSHPGDRAFEKPIETGAQSDGGMKVW
jgi:hypothetical protein